MDESFVRYVLSWLLKKGATEVKLIHFEKGATLTDWIVLATGNVDRHVVALADYVQEEAKKIGVSPWAVEGRSEGDWVVVDFGDCMVHLLTAPMRGQYQLDRLWSSSAPSMAVKSVEIIESPEVLL